MYSFYPETDDGITTDAPSRHRVGHELEFFQAGATRGDLENYAQTVLPLEGMRAMQADGVCTPPDERMGRIHGIHSAHCRCDDSTDYPLHPTPDGGIEWIIGGPTGVLFGSEAYYQAVDILCRYAALHNFGPYHHSYAGGHVHVSLDSTDQNLIQRIIAGYRRFWNEMTHLAAGDYNTVRGYQARFDGPSEVLRVKSYGAIEFRQWNGSCNPTTLHMSAAVSVAVVEAATAMRPPEDYTSLVDWIAPHLTRPMVETVISYLGATDRPRVGEVVTSPVLQIAA